MLNWSFSTRMTEGESSWQNTSTSKVQKQPGIGIDLGTTYSCVGIWQHGRVEIITNDMGDRTTPSWVAFTKTECLIGEAAKSQASMNPTNTIFDTKRLIGRNFEDQTVQQDMMLWPFKVVADTRNGDKPAIVVTFKGEEKEFYPEQISAMILAKMKEIAETYLGKQVQDAVVTVPAYFNDAQRQATKDVGVIAGLNVLHIINEPTAAAIAYGLDMKLTRYNVEPKNILVFDLGGGTFDVSLVEVKKDVFEVKAVNGDTHLGGADFDARIVGDLIALIARKYNKDLRDNPRALGRLRAACERAKRQLSWTTEAAIVIDSLFDNGVDFSLTLTRARFEQLNHDLFEKCLNRVESCLKDAKMKKTDVHDIVLVGGSTRIPKVRQLLQDYFDRKDFCMSINADEAVAYGAACHAAMLAGVGDHKDTVLIDVTPLSLGIENHYGQMVVVVPRNTTIPTKKYAIFQTSCDNQGSAIFRVYEGEIYIAKDNNFLGEFVLHNIPLGPKGAYTFNVYFEIDANGILTVSAILNGTHNMNHITITQHSGRLTKAMIDMMVKEGEMYKLQDEESKRAAVEAKKALEHYIEEAKSMVRRCRNRINEEDKRLVEDAIEQTLGWLDWNDCFGDASMFEQKKDELQRVFDDVLGNVCKIEATNLNDVD